MAAFRLLDQDTQYRNDDGTLCAGGQLRFYDTGTTTPKDVYAEAALSTNLGATVDLDAAGRAENDIWLDGEYRVRLYDADSVQIWSRDNVRDIATGGLVPLDPATGTDGQVYKTDGVDPYWDDVREVPDPTGSSGKYLGTDGTLLTWTAFPASVTYDADNLPGGITENSTTITIGNTMIIRGSSTMASTGALTGSKAVTFATAFTGTPHVMVELTGSGGHTPQGAKVGHSVVPTSTGFTFYAYAADEHDSPGWLITNTVAFDYVAIGSIA